MLGLFALSEHANNEIRKGARLFKALPQSSLSFFRALPPTVQKLFKAPQSSSKLFKAYQDLSDYLEVCFVQVIILQESARKKNDSVRFLITLNRLDYSRLYFEIILEY